MTNSDKLEEWHKDQRENHGLEDCKLSLNPETNGDNTTTDAVAGDILVFISNLNLTSPLEGI